MDRREFMAQLERQLDRISPEEKADAIAYYNEYFDEAGPENEAWVIEKLISPARVAAQIKADSAIRGLDEAGSAPVKKGISTIWLVLLGILALPIALPIAIGAFGVCVGLLAAAFGVIISLVAVVVAAFVSGIVVAVAGACAIVVHPPTGIFYIGVGLLAIGISLLIGLLVFMLSRGMVSAIAYLMNRIRSKGKNSINNKMRRGDVYE